MHWPLLSLEFMGVYVGRGGKREGGSEGGKEGEKEGGGGGGLYTHQ